MGVESVPDALIGYGKLIPYTRLPYQTLTEEDEFSSTST